MTADSWPWTEQTTLSAAQTRLVWTRRLWNGSKVRLATSDVAMDRTTLFALPRCVKCNRRTNTLNEHRYHAILIILFLFTRVIR